MSCSSLLVLLSQWDAPSTSIQALTSKCTHALRVAFTQCFEFGSEFQLVLFFLHSLKVTHIKHTHHDITI